MIPGEDWWPPLAGLVVGIVLGAAARWRRFCTLGAFERCWYADDANGLRSWALAAAVAIAASAALAAAGLFEPRASFYLGARPSLVGIAVGGFLFGLGMALVGTCAFGALVRAGGGSLGGLVVIAVVGLCALVAQRGLLADLREGLHVATVVDLGAVGDQSLPSLAAQVAGPAVAPAVAPLVVLVLLALVFASADYRARRSDHVAAALIGLAIAAGWLATTTLAGTLFRPVQIESASFVLPPGEALLAAITPSPSVPDYGIGLLVGVPLGAFSVAVVGDELRWEACDDARELGRHLAGAALMGVGGIMATGCTIGQGLSALSLLALSAPIALGAIALGARAGLIWLIEGRLPFQRSGQAVGPRIR